jgi:hypothetical protein
MESGVAVARMTGLEFLNHKVKIAMAARARTSNPIRFAFDALSRFSVMDETLRAKAWGVFQLQGMIGTRAG